MSDNFIIGKPYFLLHFLDENLESPEIISLVFLGKNIERMPSDGDLWFFQDAKSYFENGAYDGTGKEITEDYKNRSDSATIGQVYDFPESQLHTILTLKELIEDLRTLGKGSG